MLKIFHIESYNFPNLYRSFTVYFLIQYYENKLTKSEIINIKYYSKNTAIYASFLTYMAIFFSYAAFLSGNLLDPCRLLGLMQTVHTSAVGCCFHRITCYFLQNCSCNIFLFVAYHITHLQFHFSIKVYLILQFIPFKC